MLVDWGKNIRQVVNITLFKSLTAKKNRLIKFVLKKH